MDWLCRRNYKNKSRTKRIPEYLGRNMELGKITFRYLASYKRRIMGIYILEIIMVTLLLILPISMIIQIRLKL
jgi:hypothetical protein